MTAITIIKPEFRIWLNSSLTNIFAIKALPTLSSIFVLRERKDNIFKYIYFTKCFNINTQQAYLTINKPIKSCLSI